MESPIGDLRRYLDQLWSSVDHLALPADEQISYLRWLGTLPLADELGLEFDDAFRMFPQLVNAGLLTTAQAAAIATIDQTLSRISGNSNVDLWTEHAVRTLATWEEIRRDAAKARLLRPDG